ncbi:MAG: hypothetical protein KAS72_11140 [Phycisphaerales bacterium]|nr:hypothetical protein [Phycisphaerales bacterium]
MATEREKLGVLRADRREAETAAAEALLAAGAGDAAALDAAAPRRVPGVAATFVESLMVNESGFQSAIGGEGETLVLHRDNHWQAGLRILGDSDPHDAPKYTRSLLRIQLVVVVGIHGHHGSAKSVRSRKRAAKKASFTIT